MNTDIEKEHARAKIRLLDLKATFFSSIVYSLKLIWSNKVATAGINSTYLYINPDWYGPLDIDEKAGLLCHEAMHIALDHLGREQEQGLDHKKYNAAADYVINNHLDNQNFKLPTGGLINHHYDNMTTEQVYDLLPEMPEMELDLIPEEEGAGDPAEAKERMKEILVRAKTAAEMDDTIGSVPGEILRRIEELINPKLNWRVILDRFFQDKAKIDYSWFKPNRRFFPQHYLPTLDGVTLGHIVVAIDLSGSITDHDLRAFLTEIKFIQESLNPEKLTVLGWDTEISDEFEITPDDDILDLKFTGGGGTDFHPVMRWINDKKPQGAVIFTDGEYAEWEWEVESDLIFIIKDNPDYVSNIGETIYYDN